MEFGEAVKQTERIIEEGQQQFPGDEYLLEAESQLAKLLADEERSIEALALAFKRNPHSQFIAVRLAKLLIASGKIEDAKQVYKTAIEAGVNDKQVHFNYAKLLIDHGTNVEHDIEYHLRLAFTEGDANTEAQFWYARQLYINGKLAESRDRFRQLKEVRLNRYN